MERLRIIVLGDAGVGKTAFLKLITEDFEQIYPISHFDYFVFPDEMKTQKNNANEEKKTDKNNERIHLKNTKDGIDNNINNNNNDNIRNNYSNIDNKVVEQIMKDIFYQAKKNFLNFVEERMIESGSKSQRGKNKCTYGSEIYTFLWNKGDEFNTLSHRNIPINIVKQNRRINIENHDNYRNANNNSDEKHRKGIVTEFFEIGGSQTYSCIRNVFYKDFDGIMLVYDSTNSKSYSNLVFWLYELYIRRKLPSVAFCSNDQNKKYRFWKFFQKKKENIVLNDEVFNSVQTKVPKNIYSKKYKSSFDDDFYSDENLDVEKGNYKKNDDILKGEIPVVCVSTKIDKIDSKEKPKNITLKIPGYISMFFFTNISNDSIYEKGCDPQQKKKILKELQQHINKANVIKSSSIDYVVDIDKLFHFLNVVYEKKYK